MRTINAGLLAVVSGSFTALGYAQSLASEYRLKIERQPVATALIDFSKQTGLQIAYFPESLDGNMHIGPLRGSYTAEAAVRQLLLSSGLSFEQLNDRTIAVTELAASNSRRKGFLQAERKEGLQGPGPLLRLADLRWAERMDEPTAGNPQRVEMDSDGRSSGGRKADVLEEVIVTAERRADKAQDVPISMTVFTSGFINEFIRDAHDVASYTPNFQIASDTDFAGGSSAASVRGIGLEERTSPTSSSSILTYYDGIAFDTVFGAAIPQWDLERIEVLRGPQGTLFGRNAVGGAIQYISAEPTDELAGYSQFSVGEFSLRQFEGAVGGPITDNVKGRLSALVYDRGGDVTSVTTNTKLRELEWWGVRGMLDWQITDRLTARLKAQYFDSETSNTMLFNSVPGNLLRDRETLIAEGTDPDLYRESNYRKVQSSFRDPFSRFDLTLAELDMNYDFGNVGLTSITGYVQGDSVGLVDFIDRVPPTLIVAGGRPVREDQWSQELRLASQSDAPLQWITGAYFERSETSTGNQVISLTNLVPGLAPPGSSLALVSPSTDQKVESYALFMHTTYRWTERLKTTHAARYTYEDQSIGIRQSSLFAYPLSTGVSPGTVEAEADDLMRFARLSHAQQRAEAVFVFSDPNRLDVNGNIVPTLFSDSWEEVTWRLAADYDLTGSALVYSSISTGFKSGRFVRAFDLVTPVDPEKSLVYEVGAKSEWLDNRLRVNVSVFYNDHKDFQTTQFIVFDEPDPVTGDVSLLRIENLPNVEVYGGELEIQAMPSENLFIAAGLGTLKSKITKALPGNEADEGNELPSAEDLNFSGLVRYDIRVPYGTFSPQLSGRYRGKYWSTKDNNNFTGKLGNFWTADFRLSYESRGGNLYGLIYVQNLFDEVQPVNSLIPRPSDSDLSRVNQRRNWGVTVGYRF